MRLNLGPDDIVYDLKVAAALASAGGQLGARDLYLWAVIEIEYLRDALSRAAEEPNQDRARAIADQVLKR